MYLLNTEHNSLQQAKGYGLSVVCGYEHVWMRVVCVCAVMLAVHVVDMYDYDVVFAFTSV